MVVNVQDLNRGLATVVKKQQQKLSDCQCVGARLYSNSGKKPDCQYVGGFTNQGFTNRVIKNKTKTEV